MEMMTSTNLVRALLAVTLGGCGGITAEPIKERSGDLLNLNDRDASQGNDGTEAAADEPYACHIIVIPPADTEHTPINSVPAHPRNGDADAAVCNVGTAPCNVLKDIGHAVTNTVTGESTGTLDLELACSSPCSADADCPAALSGTAEPACVQYAGSTQGVCYLTCEHGERCPDAFTCISKADEAAIGRAICVQAETVDYSFTYPVGGAAAGAPGN